MNNHFVFTLLPFNCSFTITARSLDKAFEQLILTVGEDNIHHYAYLRTEPELYIFVSPQGLAFSGEEYNDSWTTDPTLASRLDLRLDANLIHRLYRFVGGRLTPPTEAFSDMAQHSSLV